MQKSTLSCLIYQPSLAFPVLFCCLGVYLTFFSPHSFLSFVFTSQRVKPWKRLLIQGGCGVSVLGNNKILTGHAETSSSWCCFETGIDDFQSPFQLQLLHDFVVAISLSAEVNSQQLMAETSECLKAPEGLKVPSCLDLNTFETP